MVNFNEFYAAMHRPRQTLIRCYINDLKAIAGLDDLIGEANEVISEAWNDHSDKPLSDLIKICSKYIRNRFRDMRRRSQAQKRDVRMVLREFDGEVALTLPENIHIQSNTSLPYNFALVQEVLERVEVKLRNKSELHLQYFKEKIMPTEEMRSIHMDCMSSTNKVPMALMMKRLNIERGKARKIEKDIQKIFKDCM